MGGSSDLGTWLLLRWDCGEGLRHRTMACVGFMNHGLINGTICWFLLAVVATIVQNAMFVKETPRITRAESRSLGLVVVWTSCICMWLFWSFVYMHQLVPIIYPVHTKVLE